MLLGGRNRSSAPRGLETWEVEFGRRRIAKQLPPGATDAQVRAAFADEYRQARSNVGTAVVKRPPLEKPKPEARHSNGRASSSSSGAALAEYGLRQQIGGRNAYGRFDVDIAPPGLEEMRRRHPGIKRWEEWAWRRSQDLDDVWLSWKFPFVHFKYRPAKEHGFVAFESLRDGSFSYQPLWPQQNPSTGDWMMIKKPPNADGEWRITKPGYRTVIINHVHGIPYGSGVRPGKRPIRGPSREDQGTAKRNPDAYSVLQARTPTGDRQYFYFGPRVDRESGVRAERKRGFGKTPAK